MNIFERSLAYITRKKTRSIIVLLILSVIASSIYACLSINRAAGGLEQRISKTSNSSFSIIKNPSSNGIKTSDIKKIAEKHNINSINYKHSTDVKLNTGTVVSENQKIQVDNADKNLNNLLKLHSIADSTKENAFTSEAFKLISGNHINSAKNQNQIMVHEKLASKNNWKIGGKITLSKLTDDKIKNEFTITGIFSGQVQENFNGLSSDLSENTAYTNFESGRPLATPTQTAKPNQNPTNAESQNQSKTSQNDLADSATFFLDQPEKIDQIIASIKNYPLNWQQFDIVKNTKAFENVISSIKTMKAIIGVMTLGIIAAGIAALSLILVLWLRERVYEIGILLAIGQEKIKIIGQFILELALISIPTTIVTIFLGNFLSAQLLTSLLGGEDLSKLSGSLSISPLGIENLIVLGASLVILLAIITSAVLITSFTILSQKPKKILSKIS